MAFTDKQLEEYYKRLYQKSEKVAPEVQKNVQEERKKQQALAVINAGNTAVGNTTASNPWQEDIKTRANKKLAMDIIQPKKSVFDKVVEKKTNSIGVKTLDYLANREKVIPEGKISSPRTKNEIPPFARIGNTNVTPSNTNLKPSPFARRTVVSKPTEKASQNITWEDVHNFNKLVGKARNNAIDYAGAVGMSALSNVNKGIADGIDWILPDVITPPVVKDIGNYFRNAAGQYQQQHDEKADKLDKSGTLKFVSNNIAKPVLEAVPDLALAYMTGGTSAAGKLSTTAAKALGTAGEVGKVSGALNAIGQTAKEWAKTPNFWSSLVKSSGNLYSETKEEAKQMGMDDAQAELAAQATAILGGTLNAGIEVSGGVEAIPKSIPGIKSWVKNMLDEGKEEALQSIVGNATKSLVYDKNKPFLSMTDENAVINPKRALTEFAGGAAAGGILGAGTLFSGRKSNVGNANTILPQAQAPQLTEIKKENVEQAPSGVSEINSLPANGNNETNSSSVKLDTSSNNNISQNETVVNSNDMQNSEEYAQNITPLPNISDNAPQITPLPMVDNANQPPNNVTPLPTVEDNAPQYTPDNYFLTDTTEPKPTLTQRVKNIFGKQVNEDSDIDTKNRALQRQLIDEGADIMALSDKNQNSNLYALYDSAKNAETMAQNMLTRRQADLTGKPTGKALNDILEPIMSKGDKYYNQFQNYLYNKLHTERVLQDKGILPDNLVMTEAQIQDIEKQYPDFVQTANEIYGYLDNLNKIRVDSGLTTQGNVDLMKAMYPHYVPAYRDVDEMGNDIGDGIVNDMYGLNDVGGLSTKTGIKSAKGGIAPILPLHEQLTAMTRVVTKNAMNNRAVNRIADLANANSASGFANAPVRVDDANIPVADNTIRFRRNGELYDMQVSEGMQYGLNSIMHGNKNQWDKALDNKIGKAVTAANKGFKNVTTEYNPTFALRNPIRDTQEALIYSKDTGAFVKHYGGAWNEMARQGEYWELYNSFGGTANTYFEDNGKAFKKKSNTTAGKVLHTISPSNINRHTEQITRFAEFYATLKKQGKDINDLSYDDVATAMYNAAEVTTNFKRGGTLTKAANKTLIPYLNASVQGFDKFLRSLQSSKSGGKVVAGVIAKMVLLGMGARFANELLFKALSKEDEFKKIRDTDKNASFLIPALDGTVIKIPYGRATAVVGGAYQAVRNLFDEEISAESVANAFGDWFQFSLENIGPINPFESNLIAPIQQINDNKSWNGVEIETQADELKPVAERYDATTSEVGKNISKYGGSMLGISPKKADYLLNQYGGFISDFGLPIFTNMPTSKNTKQNIADIATKSLWDPVKNAFSFDTTFKNNISQSYYDKKDKITQASNSDNATVADKIIYKYYNTFADEISELNKQLREVDTLTDLSSEEKYRKKTELKTQINDIMSKAVTNADKYAQNALKYSGNAKDDKVVKLAYQKANKDTFGAEYAIEKMSTSRYEKAQEVVKKGADWDKIYEILLDTDALDDNLTNSQKADALEQIILKKPWSKEQKKLIADNYINNTVIIPQENDYDYTNKDTFILSTMSDSKEKKYPEVKAQFPKMTTKAYNDIVSGMGSIEGVKDLNGNTIKGTKKSATIKYLQTKGFDYQGALRFYSILN